MVENFENTEHWHVYVPFCCRSLELYNMKTVFKQYIILVLDFNTLMKLNILYIFEFKFLL